MATNSFLLDRIQGLIHNVEAKASTNSQRIMVIEQKLFGEHYYFGVFPSSKTLTPVPPLCETFGCLIPTTETITDSKKISVGIDGVTYPDTTPTLADFGLRFEMIDDGGSTKYVKITSESIELFGSKLMPNATTATPLSTLPIFKLKFTIGSTDTVVAGVVFHGTPNDLLKALATETVISTT